MNDPLLRADIERGSRGEIEVAVRVAVRVAVWSAFELALHEAVGVGSLRALHLHAGRRLRCYRPTISRSIRNGEDGTPASTL